MHVFFICNGYHYFFCRQIIEYLEIKDPVFICKFNPVREQGLLKRIKKENSVVIDYAIINQSLKPNIFRPQRAVRKIIKQLRLEGEEIEFYAPYYRNRRVNYFISALQHRASSVSFNMFPDSINLLVEENVIRKVGRKYAKNFVARMGYTEPGEDQPYSSLISKVYHYDAPYIHAPKNKLVIIPTRVAVEGKAVSEKMLLIGGALGANEKLLKAARKIHKSEIIYKPHPVKESDRKEQDIIRKSEAVSLFREDKDTSIEQVLTESPYKVVAGSFSSVLVFSKLFSPETRTVFFFDETNAKDIQWHHVAEGLGIEIIPL